MTKRTRELPLLLLSQMLSLSLSLASKAGLSSVDWRPGPMPGPMLGPTTVARMRCHRRHPCSIRVKRSLPVPRWEPEQGKSPNGQLLLAALRIATVPSAADFPSCRRAGAAGPPPAKSPDTNKAGPV